MKSIPRLVKSDKLLKTWKEDSLASFVIFLATYHLSIRVYALKFIDCACLDLLVDWEERHQTLSGEFVFDWEELRSVFQRHAWGNNGKVQFS